MLGEAELVKVSVGIRRHNYDARCSLNQILVDCSMSATTAGDPGQAGSLTWAYTVCCIGGVEKFPVARSSQGFPKLPKNSLAAHDSPSVVMDPLVVYALRCVGLAFALEDALGHGGCGKRLH